MYDPATNTWTNKSPMPTARNHAFSGVVNGKIYVIGGRLGAAHVTASSNTDVVEEYDPARDSGARVKSRMPTPRSGGGWAHLQRAHLRRRRRRAARARELLVPRGRSVRAGDEPLDRLSVDAAGAPRRRRRVHRQQVPPGERKAGRRRAAGPGIQGAARRTTCSRSRRTSERTDALNRRRGVEWLFVSFLHTLSGETATVGLRLSCRRSDPGRVLQLARPGCGFDYGSLQHSRCSQQCGRWSHTRLATRHQIDAVKSRVTIVVGKAGAFSFLAGHTHEVSGPIESGRSTSIPTIRLAHKCA